MVSIDSIILISYIPSIIYIICTDQTGLRYDLDVGEFSSRRGLRYIYAGFYGTARSF
jgi:hypothetical protein